MSHAHHRWHVVGPSLNGRIVRGGWSRFACRRRQSRPSHGGACARYLARERGRAGGALGEQEASAARSSARQRYYVTPVGVGAAGRGGPEAHEDRGALMGASGGRGVDGLEIDRGLDCSYEKMRATRNKSN